MSIARNILGRDLIRLASEGEALPFPGRVVTDPAVLADDKFRRENGMSRAEWAERERILDQEESGVTITGDLAGEPPPDIGDEKEIRNGITRTKSVAKAPSSPQLARYALYHAWCVKLVGELVALERKKVELEAIIVAPVQAKSAVRDGIRRTADWLLGRANGSGEGEAKELANELAIAQHRADAAKVALPELERDIDRARLRLKFLEGREADFLNPALGEMADHLGSTYLQQIAALRQTAGLLFGLSTLIQNYGDGFQTASENIKFPRMGLPSIRHVDDKELFIPGRGDFATWRQIIESLRRDPRSDVGKLLPAPQSPPPKIVHVPVPGYLR